MSKKTFPTVSVINLVNVTYTVELVVDKFARETTIEFVNSDATDFNIGCSSNNLTIVQRNELPTSATRNQPGGLPLSSAHLETLGQLTAPVAHKRRFLELFRAKKSAVKMEAPLTSGVLTITAAPATFFIHNCLSVKGAIAGDLFGNIHGTDTLHVSGANNVHFRSDGNSNVALKDVVGQITVQAFGASRVKVAGTPKRLNADARRSAQIEVYGSTSSSDLRLRSEGTASISLIGNGSSVDIFARNHSVIRVTGICADARLIAYDVSEVTLSKVTGVTEKDSHSLSTIKVG